MLVTPYPEGSVGLCCFAKGRYSEGGENIGGCCGLLRSVVNTMQWKVGTIMPPPLSVPVNTDLFLCRERHRCGLGQ